MFEAVILVCAATFSMGIDQSRCVELKDIYGPFKTEENCRIRTNQMEMDFSGEEGTSAISFLLGNSPTFYFKQICNNLKDGTA